MMARKILAEFTVTPALAGKTGAAALKEELKLSARQRQKVIRTGGLKVDGRVIHSNSRLKEGQLVQVSLPAEEQVKVKARPLPLEIIYEDDALLVVNKPAGVIVHHVKPNQNQVSLVEGAAYYLQQQGRVITPRPVHRLDRGTSGIVVFAKSAQIQQLLAEAWPEVTKIYLARVHGTVKQGGEITTPIKGKPARTKYTPIAAADGTTTLEVQIFTGRTHQIRIHLAQLGHPVVGDYLYNKKDDQSCRQRLALHCWKLCLNHPVTGESLQLIAPASDLDF